MAQRKRAFGRAGPQLTHPNAAGIDIGNASHYVAVPPDRDDEPVREFASVTGDLQRLADWLTACGVDTVAMESTGVYWIPLFELLGPFDNSIARRFHLAEVWNCGMSSLLVGHAAISDVRRVSTQPARLPLPGFRERHRSPAEGSRADVYACACGQFVDKVLHR